MFLQNISNPPIGFPYLESIIQYPESSIQYLESSIQYPESGKRNVLKSILKEIYTEYITLYDPDNSRFI